METASARPRKHFFLEMFTRDISLEDCVLDLVDNSIDGLVRTYNIDLSTSLLQDTGYASGHAKEDLPVIEISFSENQFTINDTCGGIPQSHAINDVFNFGHGPEATSGWLGVYGIGLKRAIFKLGERFEMKSQTVENGFTVDLDVKAWAEKDEEMEDWKIPIDLISSSATLKKAGTKIKISKLREEVVMRLNDGTFEQRLRKIISQSYGLFINRYVVIILNKKEVEPFEIPIGKSEKITPGHDAFQIKDVNVEIITTLAAKSGQEWKVEPAGWYVLCNGRIVVVADKTELTGWGTGLPQFHGPKFRRFVGVVSFQSKNPLELPWTTSKRGLNRESAIYQLTRNRMAGVGKPILTFLDSLYPREVLEAKAEREIADGVQQVALSKVIGSPGSTFDVVRPKRQTKTTTRVAFDAESVDVETIRRHLNKPKLPASQVGQITFDYYLKNECPE